MRNLVPIPEAPHRVVLSTLQGVTPELLGEYVERTPPPPVRPSPSEPEAPTAAAPTRRSPARRHAADCLPPSRPPSCSSCAGGVWWFAIRDTRPTYDPGAFNVHAWAPDWELDESTPQLPDRANVFHQVSPFWYEARGVSIIDLSGRVDTDEEREATEEFLDEARYRGIPLVASITDATEAGVMAAMLADPVERAAHVQAIAEFAASNDFAGIDINYENFAFDDDRDTWATTRPNWVTFITELGRPPPRRRSTPHGQRPLVVDAGRTEDSGYWVYDYGSIAPHVDAIRVHRLRLLRPPNRDRSPRSTGSSDIVDGSIEAAGGPEKLVLGIPLYGRNWVTATDGECPDGADGDTAVQLDSVERPDRPARRDADVRPNDETGESSFTYQLTFTEGDTSCTQTREVHYVDAEGARQRMQLSIDEGLLGVALVRLRLRRRSGVGGHRRDQRHVGDGPFRQRRTDDHRGADDTRTDDRSDHGGATTTAAPPTAATTTTSA